MSLVRKFNQKKKRKSEGSVLNGRWQILKNILLRASCIAVHILPFDFMRFLLFVFLQAIQNSISPAVFILFITLYIVQVEFNI